MSGLAAGRLRHRLAIEEKTVTQDPTTGAIVETWAVVPGLERVPADVAPLSTREWLAAAAIQSEIKGRIVLRYRTGLTATMRARDLASGLVYQFAGTPVPDRESGRQWLTIPVEDGAIDPLPPT